MQTSNNLEHPKTGISPQIQTVAKIFKANLEHIKEKGAKYPFKGQTEFGSVCAASTLE